MTAPKSIENELILDEDFVQYLYANKGNLPVHLEKRTVSSIEDISGNINRVKRIHFENHSTLIVKHVPALGKLAKYPSITFSEDRLEFESQWFNLAKNALSDDSQDNVLVPEVFYFDKDMRLMIMEDLGQTSLCDHIAQSKSIDEKSLIALGTAIAIIHNQSTNTPEAKNQAALQNHPFIFSLHLKEPESIKKIWKSGDYKNKALGLDTKLEFQKQLIEKDAKHLIPVIERLESKLSSACTRVFNHGDLHTKSIIKADKGCLGIIDAELSSFGYGAFDIGFLLAHLIAELLKAGHKDYFIVYNLVEAYRKTLAQKNFNSTDYNLYEDIIGYCGIELLRRLYGPASFNVDITREEFVELHSISLNCLLNNKSAFARLLKENL